MRFIDWEHFTWIKLFLSSSLLETLQALHLEDLLLDTRVHERYRTVCSDFLVLYKTLLHIAIFRTTLESTYLSFPTFGCWGFRSESRTLLSLGQ